MEKTRHPRQIIPMFDMRSTVTCYPACKKLSVAGVGFWFREACSPVRSVLLVGGDGNFGFILGYQSLLGLFDRGSDS